MERPGGRDAADLTASIPQQSAKTDPLKKQKAGNPAK
jgi:hypothetical protein